MKLKNKPTTKGQSEFLLLGSIIAFLIAFSPYLFYTYEIFPNGSVWENSFFIYESKYYENVATAMWTYLSKITPLFLLLIWFFTCKHWWYHVILIPISMYTYQIIVTFYSDVYLESAFFMDTDGLIYLAPFFIVILSIVYLVRVKIFDRVYGLDLSELERENISPFSPLSDRDYEDVKTFRADGKSDVKEKDYYAKL